MASFMEIMGINNRVLLFALTVLHYFSSTPLGVRIKRSTFIREMLITGRESFKARQYDDESVVREIDRTLSFASWLALRPASLPGTLFIFVPQRVADLSPPLPSSTRHKKPQTDVRSLKSFPSLPFHKPSCRVRLFRPYHPSFTSQTLCFLLLQRPRAIYSLTVPSALRLPFNPSISGSLSLFLFFFLPPCTLACCALAQGAVCSCDLYLFHGSMSY